MQQPKYSVNVDAAAKSKMTRHARFLAQVSVPAAQRLRNAYQASLKSLEINPQRCPLYNPSSEIQEELRYLLFSARYRIVFEIIGDSVYVYDVQDTRQDLDKSIV